MSRIRTVFGDEAPTAICVAWFESRIEPDVVHVEKSGKPSVGIFQISADNIAGRNIIGSLAEYRVKSQSEAKELLLDPETNINVAHTLWESEGWLPHWAAQRRRCNLTY